MKPRAPLGVQWMDHVNSTGTSHESRQAYIRGTYVIIWLIHNNKHIEARSFIWRNIKSPNCDLAIRMENPTIISQPFYGKGTQGESHNYFQVVLGQGC